MRTLTHFSTVYGPNGRPRLVKVSLPYISSIADDPHYAAPPTPEPKQPLAIERPPRWSERNIRRALGRDREQAAGALKKVGFEATMRRIMREGA